MKYPKVRDVLNKLQWDIDYDALRDGESIPMPDLEYAILTIQDRVSGEKEISGADIIKLGRRYLDVRNEDKVVTIPYYKVIRVVLGNELIWERPKPSEEIA